MAEDKKPKANPLLTPKALQLSLSAPRCPPHGTVHRAKLVGKAVEQDIHYLIEDHDHDQAHSDYNRHSGIREQLSHLFYNGEAPPHFVPHPHVEAGPALGDQVTRWLGTVLPLEWQHSVRDSGGFRSISDTLVTASIPLAAVTHPRVALKFGRLTRQVHRISYGDHASQFVDMFFPPNCSNENYDEATGLIFFVHGGAWGSGKPWFYRLVADAFLPNGLVVAIVGYRVYPDADASTQRDDLIRASQFLAREYPGLCGRNRTNRRYGTSVMGHSSGAHIALNMVIQNYHKNERNAFSIDSFVGISGPYDISHHYDYEAARGVEELSPMKAVCGSTRQAFRTNTPAFILQDSLTTAQNEITKTAGLPKRIGLFHGIEDETVPFTATAECARGLRACGVDQCDEIYIPTTGHQEAVVHLMLGGPTKDAILEWMDQDLQQENGYSDCTNLRSRL